MKANSNFHLISFYGPISSLYRQILITFLKTIKLNLVRIANSNFHFTSLLCPNCTYFLPYEQTSLWKKDWISIIGLCVLQCSNNDLAHILKRKVFKFSISMTLFHESYFMMCRLMIHGFLLIVQTNLDLRNLIFSNKSSDNQIMTWK